MGGGDKHPCCGSMWAQINRCDPGTLLTIGWFPQGLRCGAGRRRRRRRRGCRCCRRRWRSSRVRVAGGGGGWAEIAGFCKRRIARDIGGAAQQRHLPTNTISQGPCSYFCCDRGLPVVASPPFLLTSSILPVAIEIASIVRQARLLKNITRSHPSARRTLVKKKK
ncbi:hypothetical protein BOTBODRAFT_462577 [Botryobasidium botryosum FD-172 SS1]|uniref:Uncharacterized protein n=1 Tax=Botryobasidium botryosum (strain FD-172 SS1) TaxID=930990 RepID=A0A067M6N5_BOTB1|nr:hypothetical protein BOTBODRAFT_462577 [Botryobasidium botryosum FD-172 SS1]